MYYVYILRSKKTGRYYCGQTVNLARRLSQHNDPDNKFTKTTSRYPGPWELVEKYQCDSRSEALKLERKIKKRGIKRFLDMRTGGS